MGAESGRGTGWFCGRFGRLAIVSLTVCGRQWRECTAVIMASARTAMHRKRHCCVQSDAGPTPPSREDHNAVWNYEKSAAGFVTWTRPLGAGCRLQREYERRGLESSAADTRAR